MGKYQGYEKYKASGVEWLGEIPEHWELVRFSHFIDFQEGPGIMAADFKDDGVPLLRIHNLKPGFVELEGSNYLDPQKVEKTWKHFKLNKDDLLISCSASTGLVSIVDEKAEGSIAYTGIIRLNPANSKICQEFIRIIVGSELFFTQIELLKTGTTIQHYGPIHLRQIKITLPPLEEQEKIARFLDYKTKQIDELIAKKEALIEKLDEKRTALISHAVTKGLDPSVPMKDSGIEWLGEIPQHWEVKRTKFLVTKIGSGKTPKGGSEIYVDSGVMLIRSQNVYDEGLRLDDVVYIDDEIDNLQANSRVFPNDILLNITGASIGRVGLVPPDLKKANVNQHVCIFRPNFKEILPQYLHLLLCSQQGKEQIFSYENGTSREGLNFQQAGNLTFAIPSTDTQKQITEYLDQTTAEIDQQKAKIQKAIELLKEYRTALITNAVTGKIDVRQVPIP